MAQLTRRTHEAPTCVRGRSKRQGPPLHRDHNLVLDLQRRIGNRAVSSLVGREAPVQRVGGLVAASAGRNVLGAAKNAFSAAGWRRLWTVSGVTKIGRAFVANLKDPDTQKELELAISDRHCLESQKKSPHPRVTDVNSVGFVSEAEFVKGFTEYATKIADAKNADDKTTPKDLGKVQTSVGLDFQSETKSGRGHVIVNGGPNNVNFDKPGMSLFKWVLRAIQGKSDPNEIRERLARDLTNPGFQDAVRATGMSESEFLKHVREREAQPLSKKGSGEPKK